MKKFLVLLLISVLAIAIIIPTGALYQKTVKFDPINITVSNDDERLGLTKDTLRDDTQRVFDAMEKYITEYPVCPIVGIPSYYSLTDANYGKNPQEKYKLLIGLFESVGAENFFRYTKSITTPSGEVIPQKIKDIKIFIGKNRNSLGVVTSYYISSLWIQLKEYDEDDENNCSQMILNDGTFIEDKTGYYDLFEIDDPLSHEKIYVNLKNIRYNKYEKYYFPYELGPMHEGHWKNPKFKPIL